MNQVFSAPCLGLDSVDVNCRQEGFGTSKGESKGRWGQLLPGPRCQSEDLGLRCRSSGHVPGTSWQEGENTGKCPWILYRVIYLLLSSKGIPGLVYRGLVSRQSLA